MLEAYSGTATLILAVGIKWRLVDGISKEYRLRVSQRLDLYRRKGQKLGLVVRSSKSRKTKWTGAYRVWKGRTQCSWEILLKCTLKKFGWKCEMDLSGLGCGPLA